LVRADADAAVSVVVSVVVLPAQVAVQAQQQRPTLDQTGVQNRDSKRTSFLSRVGLLKGSVGSMPKHSRETITFILKLLLTQKMSEQQSLKNLSANQLSYLMHSLCPQKQKALSFDMQLSTIKTNHAINRVDQLSMSHLAEAI
jgi:hypothetical protein